MLIYLDNAAARLRLQDRAEARVFERILSRAGNVAAGVPPMPEPAQLPEVVNHERIIGTDDMVKHRVPRGRAQGRIGGGSHPRASV